MGSEVFKYIVAGQKTVCTVGTAGIHGALVGLPLSLEKAAQRLQFLSQ